MTPSLSAPWRILLPAAAAAAGAAAIAMSGSAPTAQANEPCPGGVYTTTSVSADAQVWEVEGRISDYSIDQRTITTNGTTFRIPAGLKIKTDDRDQANGNIEFSGPNSLTDHGPDIKEMGATTIASGTVSSTAVPEGGFCINFDATSVFVEPAEHGIVAPLLDVDVQSGSFVVGGTLVKMNEDDRFPRKIVDAAGRPITLEQLKTQTGTLLDVVGYHDAVNNTLRGMVVESEVLMPDETTDTVSVTRANFKSQELRVRGTVSRLPDGTYAPSVRLHLGGIGADGKCATQLSPVATVSIDPVGDGAFEFRIRVTTNPGRVCVQSAGGGVGDSLVTAG
jgi:hypothetical protein